MMVNDQKYKMPFQRHVCIILRHRFSLLGVGSSSTALKCDDIIDWVLWIFWRLYVTPTILVLTI
jgi:hypothetical protein